MRTLPYLKETPVRRDRRGPYGPITRACPRLSCGFDIYDQELGRESAGANAKVAAFRIEGLGDSTGTGSRSRDVLSRRRQAKCRRHYAHTREASGAGRGRISRLGRVITDSTPASGGFDT